MNRFSEFAHERQALLRRMQVRGLQDRGLGSRQREKSGKMNIPLDEWSGSKATKELQAAIERNQKASARQGWWMLIFTIIAAIGGTIAAWPVVRDWLH
jgi:hypothetical protein